MTPTPLLSSPLPPLNLPSPPATSEGYADAKQVKWEKVLWRRQPFPDNYVPPNFLAELDDLPPRPVPSLTPLLFAALPISLHLSIIALFLAVFYALLEGNVTPEEVGWKCVIFGLSGWGIHKWGWGIHRQPKEASIIPAPTPLRSLILPPLLLSLVSPVLGTLTSATTSDSIWPLAGGLGFVHLLLADFRTGEDQRVKRRREKAQRMRKTHKRQGSTGLIEVEEGEEKSLSSSLSLTSALSASVVLASRLPSTSHVFSLVLLAVLLFAGWPPIAKGVREAGKSFSLLLTFSMAMLSISLFPHKIGSTPSYKMRGIDVIPTAPTVIFLVALTLANVVGPLMLLYAWRWKTRRGGGWDVAVVKLRKGNRVSQ
ncbi:uncharacterized protein I303_102502 [Kwoniella dejecticola CBS 10117]|uniref:Phosphatidylinositol glycan, class C n=1 Tax=Kwoniella dejecticola CBS 10117 TaxID=1296121 RepID=A0A1A6A8X0_9TREE|nr:phosphatidylinositol glycan, class C [Kwoniella dejecticola CBS 10117]OBR86508.1 phosphatidylinositol glycan, class C [Kwoniella dejecticola CBS 10117]